MFISVRRREQDDLHSDPRSSLGDDIQELTWDLETAADCNMSAEEMQAQLEAQKQSRVELEDQVKAMQLKNDMESEVLRAEELRVQLKLLEETRTKAAEAHKARVAEMEKLVAEKAMPTGVPAWFQDQLKALTVDPAAEEQKRKEQLEQEDERKRQIEEVKNQQEALQKKLEALMGPQEVPRPTEPTENSKLQQLRNLLNPQPQATQDALIQQLASALGDKDAPDPQRDILKALLADSNKIKGTGGTTTLKPDILARLTGEDSAKMHDWLAQFNKQEEGENELFRITEEGEGKQTRVRSGMLDKSTMNVLHKEVWPQRNLGEDWAEDEVDFKHIRFEHLVAGETRTIELATEPDQILGRLRLLRRISYLKLRGYEWSLLRKMYAAIVCSIETGENNWASNFDRFETMLYRKTMLEAKPKADRAAWEPRSQGGSSNPNKKWYCRDWNREGCTKSAPHPAWFGSGPTAEKRSVLHVCAACLLKDRVARDHPEGHQSCPQQD